MVAGMRGVYGVAIVAVRVVNDHGCAAEASAGTSAAWAASPTVPTHLLQIRLEGSTLLK